MLIPKIDVDTFWLPKATSTVAPEVDRAWNWVLGVSVFFFFLVLVPAFYFTWKYKRKTDTDITEEIDHDNRIEVAWTAIPLAIVIGLFFLGLQGYVSASVAPANAYEINVTAWKWAWRFSYPNGTVSAGTLVVPKGRPVKLIMSSQDVIHSFYVPEFRVKQDVVPGTYTTIWFEATEAKEVALECTEYCGAGHSEMMATVKVMEEPQFRQWLDTGGDDPNVPPAEKGKALFAQWGCSTCHSIDGSRGTGPSLKGVFSTMQPLTTGNEVMADEAYLKESILQPTAKVVRSYAPVMPVFQGVLKDKQIDALIAYIKTLK
jgi:cytochrome c oxidase subunit II